MTPERAVIETLFMIADKEGNDVPFRLNSVQSKLDANLTGRDIIPKARQEGVSSYFLARGLVKCLGQRNTRAVIISHETEATQRALSKVHYMLEHIRGPKAIIKNSSKNELTFPKTNSIFYIGTAGSRKFGRGDTISFLHCSEVAYWDNPKSLLSGLFQAVPHHSGEVAIESTGNGQGNWYHKAVQRAAIGASRYRLHFFNWQDFDEYTYHLSPEEEKAVLDTLKEELDEPRLMSAYGLTPGQILWRREKLEELDYDMQLFQQEYPMTLDECFQATGRSIFAKVNYISTPEWERIDANQYILKGHPLHGVPYGLGVDVAAGVGQDRSVIEIFRLDTLEQVGEYVNDRIAPDAFGLTIAKLGHQFNKAFITVENNNHGIVTLKTLLANYPNHMVYKRPKGKSASREEVDKLTDYGFRTSVKSKPFAIGELRHHLARDMTIHSPILKGELDSYVEDENGQLGAAEGSHDDTVMACAVLSAALQTAILKTRPQFEIATQAKDPFALDSIIDEMRSRSSLGFPISLQV